jgi:hypothetical protein
VPQPSPQRGAPTKKRVAAVYRAVMTEIEKRRLELGWPAWLLDDKSGVQDGYSQKMLWADTRSGRQAGWDTVGLLADALFPHGYQVRIEAKKGASLNASKQRSKIHAAAAFYKGGRVLRDYMRGLSKKGAAKGGDMRARRLSPHRRRAIARKAAKARWHKSKITEIAGEPDLLVGQIAHEPDDLAGTMKQIGGSRSDHWNDILGNQALKTLSTAQSDEKIRNRQINATVAALVGIAPRDRGSAMKLVV